jgi:hypothetical protein
MRNSLVLVSILLLLVPIAVTSVSLDCSPTSCCFSDCDYGIWIIRGTALKIPVVKTSKSLTGFKVDSTGTAKFKFVCIRPKPGTVSDSVLTTAGIDYSICDTVATTTPSKTDGTSTTTSTSTTTVEETPGEKLGCCSFEVDAEGCFGFLCDSRSVSVRMLSEESKCISASAIEQWVRPIAEKEAKCSGYPISIKGITIKSFSFDSSKDSCATCQTRCYDSSDGKDWCDSCKCACGEIPCKTAATPFTRQVANFFMRAFA